MSEEFLEAFIKAVGSKGISAKIAEREDALGNYCLVVTKKCNSSERLYYYDAMPLENNDRSVEVARYYAERIKKNLTNRGLYD